MPIKGTPKPRRRREKIFKITAMCISPISIRNPHRHTQTMISEYGVTRKLPRKFKLTSEYIKVPCGHCADCRNTYYSSLLQRALCEHLTSYMYFVTLTYDNHHIPYIDLPNGKVVYYADYSHIQNLFKRFRDNTKLDRDFRYLAVCEFGDTYNRPHWHLLIFVAKRDTDDMYTPKCIERLLFDELQRYYAVNVGTRKHPEYDRLFTYHIHYTSRGIKTNYFVKYVDTDENNPSGSSLTLTATKTIQYLISYINKPSRFDSQIDKYISEYDSDPILQHKLRHLLKSSVHYSKHFGDGFVDGRRAQVRPISVTCSPAIAYISDVFNRYPKSLDDFYSQYPHEYKALKHFLLTYPFKDYYTIEDLMSSFDTTTFHLFTLALIYYPHTVTNIVEMHYRHKLIPTISYHFQFIKPATPYCKTAINTFTNVITPIYQYIRHGVDDGLRNAVPFLPFLIPDNQPHYVPLCKYLKQRYTTLQDFDNLLNKLGLSNYDEYINYFDTNLKTSIHREHISKSNELKHSQSEDPICIIQRHCLSLYQQEGKTFYDILFKTF